MGIQRQLHRMAIVSTLVSIALVALVALGVLSITSSTYQEVYRDNIKDYLVEHDIDPKAVEEDIYSYLTGLGVDADTILYDLTHDPLKITNFVKDGRPGPLLPVLICGAGGVIVVSLSSAFFSRRISRKIVPPLRELRKAANRVADGDLTYEVKYDSYNEFGMVRDAFTEMQTHLRASIQENVEQERKRKEMLAGISHDLRTPLTTIRGFIRALQDGILKDHPEKEKQYMQTIGDKACEMQRMTDELFLFSKLDAGSQEMQFSTISAKDYFGTLFGTIAGEMEPRGLQVEYRTEALGHSIVSIDCDQMARVITNILENSAKYMDGDAGNARVVAENTGSGILVEIADDGPGVPEEALGRLFDTF